jgi:hypothetical protein
MWRCVCLWGQAISSLTSQSLRYGIHHLRFPTKEIRMHNATKRGANFLSFPAVLMLTCRQSLRLCPRAVSLSLSPSLSLSRYATACCAYRPTVILSLSIITLLLLLLLLSPCQLDESPRGSVFGCPSSSMYSRSHLWFCEGRGVGGLV